MKEVTGRRCSRWLVLAGGALFLSALAVVFGSSVVTSAEAAGGSGDQVSTVATSIRGTSLADGGWRYDAVIPGGGSIHIIEKSLADGGCSAKATMTLGPDQVGFRVDQDDDLGVCTVTPLAVGDAEAEESGGSSLEGSGSSSAAKAGVVTASTSHSAGYYKTWFEDPVHADVNRVRNSINWYYNGSQVSSYTASHSYWWLSESGWGLKENDFDYGFGTNHDWAYSNSYVHYKNGIFCALTDTHVYYNRNKVRGYQNGTLWGHVDWTKSGNCSGMLHTHYSLVRTLN